MRSVQLGSEGSAELRRGGGGPAPPGESPASARRAPGFAPRRIASLAAGCSLAVSLLGTACGTTADVDPSSPPPVSGAGPFRPLDPDPELSINAPVVLSDNNADLDDPTVVADGESLALWVTARRAGTIGIEHADAITLTDGFGPLQPALVADQGWEAGAVSGPSVIAPEGQGEPWLLFYSAGGAIGLARAIDGHSFTKTAGPILSANLAEEGQALGAPAAARLGSLLRVYYPAGGSLWAAEAELAPLLAGEPGSWRRLDGDAARPGRDPVLVAPGWAAGIARTSVRVRPTAAGRLRHDLYFTAALDPASPSAPLSGCGFAASFDGLAFAAGALPILPPIFTTRAPAALPYRGGLALLYVQHLGVRDVVAAAVSP